MGRPPLGKIVGLTEKHCPRCKTDRPVAEFGVSAKSRDGLAGWCRDCQRDYMRDRKGDPVKRRSCAKASEARHPDRRRAREKVKDAVRAGRLARVGTLACSDCGVPAKAYDHFAGYDKPLTVEAVCHECHGKRSRARGEHKREPVPV